MRWKRRNTEDDFWARVDIKDSADCWEWQASHPTGYGQFRYNGKYERAHKLAYEFAFGEVSDSLVVRHLCFNKLCCNPNHLQLGTHTDNARDEDRTELNWDKVHYIREQHLKGVRQKQIAQELGISKANIWAIVHEISWREDANTYA